MKKTNKIDVLATTLTIVGFVISGVSLLVGNKQAKLHREEDKQSMMNEILKQLENK